MDELAKRAAALRQGLAKLHPDARCALPPDLAEFHALLRGERDA